MLYFIPRHKWVQRVEGRVQYSGGSCYRNMNRAAPSQYILTGLYDVAVEQTVWCAIHAGSMQARRNAAGDGGSGEFKRGGSAEDSQPERGLR